MPNKQGNTAGNLNNMGLVSMQDGWIYFLGVYRQREDGSDFTVINDDGAGPKFYVNAVGNWLYYQDPAAGGYIHKIQADKDFENPNSGWTKAVSINNVLSKNITVVGDWIFYINQSDGNKIYKILADGTGNQKLSNDASDFINIVDDYIYYANLDDSSRSAVGRVYKIRTDGSGRQKISEDDGCNLNVVDGWIYYGNASKGHTLWRMKPDGGGNQLLVSGLQGGSWNVVGDMVYGRIADDQSLSKLELTSDRSWKLNDETTGLVNIVGDWIYYINGQVPPAPICKMRTDGTEKKILMM